MTLTEPTPAPVVVASNPMQLIQSAIDANMGPEQLGKFLDLQERWEASRAREAFAVAMMAAQAEMPVVVKDKTNTHTNSRYASLETVQRNIKGVALKHGLSVSFGEEDCPRAGWVRVVASVRHVSGHVEKYHRDGPVDNVGAKGSPTKTELHGVASTGTYMTRHLLFGIFNITVADEDNDGNGTGGKPISNEQKSRLHQLLTETSTDVAKFLQWGGVDELALLPASKFKDAEKMLMRKVATT